MSEKLKDISVDSDLTVINAAAKLIGQSTTPEVAIGSILRLISQMLGLNRGRVLQPIAPQEKMGIRFSYGLTKSERAKGIYQLGEGISGKVMTTGREVVVQDIDEDPDFLFRAVDRKTLPDGVVSFLAVPILDDNIAVGVLGVHRLRMRPRSFDADLTVMRIIATFIAQILRINQLFNERTERLRQENLELKDALETQQTDHGILGDSPPVRAALSQVMQVADTPVTVLLTGESGTGKERFSQILHLNSRRKDKPFLALNCAAIPEQLLESELFGHERGAFTGATATKQGKVELANNGTLFLDEIGDLSLELQSKLLRILESQVVQRVGGVKNIPVDVRIIAATHKNLQEAVNRGDFRLDLFYRLNVFPIHLPPLRERAGDTRTLARHFLIMANKDYQRHVIFGNGVMERLESFSWPGNIRQLENVIKRAVLKAEKGMISVSIIESILRQESAIHEHTEAGQSSTAHVSNLRPRTTSVPIPASDSVPALPFSNRPYSWVREDELDALLDALRQTHGNKTRAAALLGMTARQFRYRLAKLGNGV
ncbi:MAG: sigma 54-interacting transcriptional regulator [Pseudomonadales bacterium]|nr:sigma 54-interacting transcriptional regulator [Pseudomonadales bacterium]